MGVHQQKNSTKYTSPIKLNKSGVIKAIAYRGDIASEIKVAEIEKQALTEAKEITPIKGKLQRWVGTNKFSIVEKVNLPSNPTWEVVSEVNLLNYEDADHVSMIFKGYFKAAEEGMYEFATKSDDGSLLYINDKLVVDNGGNHGAILRDGMIALKKGWHPITIKFHEAGGASELTVWYKEPNNERKILKGDIIGH